jgi:hypothetical protein
MIRIWQSEVKPTRPFSSKKQVVPVDAICDLYWSNVTNRNGDRENPPVLTEEKAKSLSEVQIRHFGTLCWKSKKP